MFNRNVPEGESICWEWILSPDGKVGFFGLLDWGICFDSMGDALIMGVFAWVIF